MVVALCRCSHAGRCANRRVGEPPRDVSSFYVGRPDPRLCPSPVCGGVWVRLVNEPALRPAKEASRAASATSLRSTSRAIACRRVCGPARRPGRRRRGTRRGPRLREVASQASRSSGRSSPSKCGPPRARRRDRLGHSGSFETTAFVAWHRPAFRPTRRALNSGRHTNVSRIDLSRIRTTLAERWHAREEIAEEGLIAAGTIVKEPRTRAPAEQGGRSSERSSTSGRVPRGARPRGVALPRPAGCRPRSSGSCRPRGGAHSGRRVGRGRERPRPSR